MPKEIAFSSKQILDIQCSLENLERVSDVATEYDVSPKTIYRYMSSTGELKAYGKKILEQVGAR